MHSPPLRRKAFVLESKPLERVGVVRNFRLLKTVTLALLLLTAAGTAGFHFIEGWSWFDSFYMVVITLSTIGYSEVHPLSSSTLHSSSPEFPWSS
jgi:hypothetical protein